MVIRAWLVVGVLLIGVAWYLTVFAPLPSVQATAPSAIDTYRQAGLMPPAGAVKMSTSIGHEVFELPAADAEHLKEAEASQMASIPGMNMGDGASSGSSMQMQMDDDKPGAQMQMDDAKPGSSMQMQMDDAKPAEEQAMPGMNMEAAKADADHGEKDEPMKGMAMDKPAEEQAMPGMNTAGAKPEADHAEEAEAGHGDDEAEAGEGGHAGGGGIELVSANSNTSVDRVIEVKMTEWGYSPGTVMVKPGEVVRFVVTNAGTIPHEFMIMTGPAMGAVNYRIQRADWNLTEHEAIFENPLVMPGDTFETVLKIDQPGAWMFMCMFPYHMQMGMMGMMMTEGAAGTNMDGMKM